MLSFLVAAVLGQSLIKVEYRPVYEVGEPMIFRVVGAASTASVNWKFKGVRTEKGPTPYEVHAWGVPGRYTGRCTIIDWNAKSFVDEDLEFEVRGTVPPGPTPPGPTPPGPTPPGPTPPPAPVTSFSMILVFESSATLTAAQKSVLYGVETENAMKAATAGVGTWMRLDKDAEPSNLKTPMREIWAQAKASLKPTDPPCIVFQVSDHITIEPLPDQAGMAALIAKYRGAK